MIAMIVLSLTCMALMNWKLALVPGLMFPIIVGYSVLFHNRIRDRFTACDESGGRALDDRAGESDRRARGACVWPRKF